MTWYSVSIFCLLFCVNVTHCVTSDIPSLIANLINEWNVIDPGVHDILLLRFNKDNSNWMTTVLYNEIAQKTPTLNSKIMPSMDIDQQDEIFRKASFVIIVSDVLNPVNNCNPMILKLHERFLKFLDRSQDKARKLPCIQVLVNQYEIRICAGQRNLAIAINNRNICFFPSSEIL